MKLLEDKRFYTYIYFDPRTKKYSFGQFEFEHMPFYIGKGKENRYIAHLKDAENLNKRSPKLVRIRELKAQNLLPIIVIVQNNINEKDAFALEVKLIKTIGRLDKNKGPLLNCTDGGQGQINRKFTELHKQRISETRKARKIRHTPETIERIRKTRTGKKCTPEAVKNITNGLFKRDPEIQKRFIYSRLGKKNSEEQNKKISESSTKASSKIWKICYKDNTLIITNLKDWCEQNNLEYNYIRINQKQNEFKIQKMEI